MAKQANRLIKIRVYLKLLLAICTYFICLS